MSRPGEDNSKTLICLTQQKPEISAGSMDHLACKVLAQPIRTLLKSPLSSKTNYKIVKFIVFLKFGHFMFACSSHEGLKSAF